MQAESDPEALVARASAGDHAAFETLLREHGGRLRGVVRRMVGHAEDTDDIVQETLLRAWQGLASDRGGSRFGTWLCSIGVRQAIDHLRSRKRWRGRSQLVYQNECARDAALSDEVASTLADPEFRFEAAEHIAYCFSCVGRSLPPEDQAALLLCEVVGLDEREAAQALGVSEPVLGHQLAAARRAMQEEFEGLCSLVDPKGVCHQCKGLRESTPSARRGPEIPRVADFEERLAVVRSADIDTGASQRLHDLFWRRTEQLEEAGAGDTAPGPDGGAD